MPTTLTAAFPHHLAREVQDLARQLDLPNGDQGIAVTLDGEPLTLPYRLHLPAADTARSLIHACLLTRHPDGHVRERYLQQIIRAPEAWVIPFVFQLTGEYVIELLALCEANLSTLDASAYGRFFNDNPAYFSLTRARMVSYWDCYHRSRHPHLRSYVGTRLFRAFSDFTTTTSR
ncbi:hypothetical protein B8W70_21435 [Pseudomonas sp. 1239]|uniref:hypothetical protein n=1 Tax=Pseudomonas TaxID=286 RepID=UPI000B4F7E17|nr:MULTISPECIES: hypothetical protein [Pseudomonas]MEC6741930.1 hypothetical protein [Pseudomonas qingdaonensis]OUM25301.1 hypothetical protein B8W70_21435 [Pseudomonas sp. 1239]